MLASLASHFSQSHPRQSQPLEPNHLEQSHRPIHHVIDVSLGIAEDGTAGLLALLLLQLLQYMGRVRFISTRCLLELISRGNKACHSLLENHYVEPRGWGDEKKRCRPTKRAGRARWLEFVCTKKNAVAQTGLARSRIQYTFLEKNVRSPNRPCGGLGPSSPPSAFFRHPFAAAAALASLAVAAPAGDGAGARPAAAAAFFFAPACFCSVAASCSLLRRSCHTGLGRPSRMPVPPPVLLRPWCPGTSLRNMDVGPAGDGAACPPTAASTVAAAGMAGGGSGPDSPRELLREQGALLTFRAAGAPALLATPLPLAFAAAVGLALLSTTAAPWPAERLLAKGQMLMLMSSALPPPLTRRSAFLRSLASPPPLFALKMSFHLNVTAGRSGVGAMPDSASGCAGAAASAESRASSPPTWRL
jgi:hypothetical protein